MQGYGPTDRPPRHRRAIRRSAACAAVALIAAGITACSISTDTVPSRIVIPSTDALSTESEAPISSTSTNESLDDSAPDLPNWTISRVISLAPRVDNSRFHQGSVTANSPLQDTSGFHFSTPDRAVNCSTGTNGSATLACRVKGLKTQQRPRDTPTNCRWAPNFVTLDTSGAEQGACANRYPVRYRSTMLEYGHTISISRFSCLNETAGLFCLESRSQSGFAITATGYRTIRAEDRAPAELVGAPTSDPTDEPTTTENTRTQIPTPSRPTS